MRSLMPEVRPKLNTKTLRPHLMRSNCNVPSIDGFSCPSQMVRCSERHGSLDHLYLSRLRAEGVVGHVAMILSVCYSTFFFIPVISILSSVLIIYCIFCILLVIHAEPGLCCRLCHPDDLRHLTVQCPKPCTHVLQPCGHPCPKLCYQDCGLCTRPTPDLLLPCGHTAHDIPCHRLNVSHCTSCIAYRGMTQSS